MKTASLLKIFTAVGIMYLLLTVLDFDDFGFYLKPILVPILLFAVWASDKFATKNLMFVALLLSWFGDIALMGVQANPTFFMVGLALFLFAHLTYIAVFVKQPKTNVASSRAGFYIGLVLVAGYLFGMLYLLLPLLGDLKVAVVAYALVISTMLLTALWQMPRWQNAGAYFILAGAVCFVVSDSLLAFDKFYTPLPMASFNIMSTYLSAQFLIVFGVLVLNKKQHSLLNENAAI